MPPASMFSAGDEPIRGYRLTELQSSGLGHELWKAIDVAAGIQVGCKVVDLSYSTTALKEVRALKLVRNLNHPNLVPIFAARLLEEGGREVSLDDFELARKSGRQIQKLVVVMRLGGKSLAARLREEKAKGTATTGLPVSELLRYMEGAAKGIDYLHRKDHGLGAHDGAIIHCDIKPETLMIVAGEVQIADCGLAVIMNPDPNRSLIGGTPAYCPAELTANKPVPATDQYSLAVTYHELRTGKFPFSHGLSMVDVLLIHAEGRLDFSHPSLLDEERNILKIATARRPEDRFSSCNEFVKQLRRSLDSLIQSGKSNSAPQPASGPQRSNLPVDPRDPAGKQLPPAELDTVLREIIQIPKPPDPTPAPKSSEAPGKLPLPPMPAPPEEVPLAFPNPPAGRKAFSPPPLDPVDPDPTWYRMAEKVRKDPPRERELLPSAKAMSPPPAAKKSWSKSDLESDASRRTASDSAPASSVEHRATVRYYSVMQPQRMFPLMVMISPESIRAIVKKHVSQSASAGIKVNLDRPLEIEPILPGCNCYPPRSSLMLSASEKAITKFWVVPQLVGAVNEACVQVRQEGKLIAEVPLSMVVRKPHLTWVLAGMGLVVPYGQQALKSAHLDFESQKSSGFPIYQTMLDWVLTYLHPEWIGLGFFALAIGAYFMLRPRKQDAFWDIK